MDHKATQNTAAVERQEWLKCIDEVAHDAESWAQSVNWPTGILMKRITDASIGSYQAKVVNIKTPQGWLIVDPVAKDCAGCEGRIDLYSFPRFNRAWLYWTGKKWGIQMDSGKKLRKEWSRKSFLDLASKLTDDQ